MFPITRLVLYSFGLSIHKYDIKTVGVTTIELALAVSCHARPSKFSVAMVIVSCKSEFCSPS